MANAGDYLVRIQQIDDKQAIKLIKDIASIFGSDGSEIRFQLIEGLDLTFANLPEKKIKSGSYSLQRINWQGAYEGRAVQVSFHRALFHNNEKHINGRQNDIKIHFTQHEHWRNSAEKIMEVQEKIKAVLVPSPAIIDSQSSDASILRELIVQNNGTHRAMMEELNSSLQEMVAKREELEKKSAEKEEARRAEHDAALKKLQSERELLNRESHMSARRQISKQIMERLSNVREKNTKPRGVSLTGWAVFACSITLGFVAAGFTYHWSQLLTIRQTTIDRIEEILTQGTTDPSVIIGHLDQLIGPTDWLLFARVILAGLISLGAFTYAVSWIKKYYDEDMKLIREMERFNDDIQRASWIIEAVQEIKHEAKAELPREWVEAVTKNLFEKGRVTAADDGSLAIRALMGFAAKTKVGPDGMELEFGRRGNRRIGNADLGGSEE